MTRFADTAAFFEAKARKERSPDRRKDWSETAHFYRTLDRITPTFPFGYKQPVPAKPNGSARADRLRKRSRRMPRTGRCTCKSRVQSSITTARGNLRSIGNDVGPVTSSSYH